MMLKEWKRDLKKLYILKAEAEVAGDIESVRILRGMIRDLDYAIRWVEAGHDPGPKYGASRQRRSKRNVSLDQILESGRGESELVRPWQFETEREENEFRHFWLDWHKQYGGD